MCGSWRHHHGSAPDRPRACPRAPRAPPRPTGSETVLPKLFELGYDTTAFAGVVTSGELTHLRLRERSDAYFARLGTRCLHLTWSGRGGVSLDGLGLTEVRDPEDATFILAHGVEAIGTPDGPQNVTTSDIRALLKRASYRGLPLVVANPDLARARSPRAPARRGCGRAGLSGCGGGR